jgi:hypothetical protein
VAEVTIRLATPDDWPAIVKCHEQIEERVGMKLDLPTMEVVREKPGRPGEYDIIDNPAILIWEVAECDGEIISFCYQERCIELCMGGTDPRGTAAFKAHRDQTFRVAKKIGIRFIHCAIPVECPEVGKHLEHTGFYSTAESLRYFKLDLR